MKVLIPVFSLVMIVGIEAKPTENSKTIYHLDREFGRNNGIVGVASVADATSRNGRISSVGGVRFFPETSQLNEYFYPLEFSNEKDIGYPITVSSEKDGRYATGTVQIKPGYVSASAGAAIRPYGTKIIYNPSNFATQRTAQRPFREFFIQPQPDLFLSRNFDNWFTNDFFQGLRPPAPEVMRNGWLFNDFNPFMSFWQ